MNNMESLITKYWLYKNLFIICLLFKVYKQSERKRKTRQFAEFVRKKYEREENDVTESLYFGNDFAEIGES